jgi:hypothetical protein
MSMEAQRIIDVIRQAVTQMTENGARREYVYGYVQTGGAYQVSAYLNGSDVLSDYIEVPAGMYVPSGSYIEAVKHNDDVLVVRSMPTLFARIAFDVVNGKILLGDGTAVPSNAGTLGQVIMSGGSGSAYWGTPP